MPAGRAALRLVNKADFERLLAARWRGRSAHFSLHYVPGPPAPSLWVQRATATADLSTAPAPLINKPVENSRPVEVWFGCVVPKRHARRSVTRSLLKRQVRNAFARHGAGLSAGLWLVRLRSAFATSDFVSAASGALATVARGELDGLLTQAAA